MIRVPSWYRSEQRRQFRSLKAQVPEHLIERLTDEDGFRYLERWATLSPFDERVHVRLLQVLARQQRFQEGKDHLEAVARLFEAEGLDCTPLCHAWRSARSLPVRSLPAGAIIVTEDPAAVTAAEIVCPAPRRGSIAVMPFTDRSNSPRFRSGVADALVHDVITRLAKLRSPFVIAQGTTFALHERNVPPDEAGRILNVEYVVGGSLRCDGNRMTVQVELSEALTGRIVWADIFNHSVEDAFLVLDEIGDRIVASIASEIETVERNRAILKPPNSLNAWEA